MTASTSIVQQQLPTLPALRRLGDLRDVRPVIVIDTREQTPLPFTRLPSERGTLQTGDYSFRGGEELFAVERKTIPDLVACVSNGNRERFCRELHRLRGYRFRRLLIVGTRERIDQGHYRSQTAPNAVRALLSVAEARYDVPVVFEPNPATAAHRIESWAWWAARELIQSANTLARAYAASAESGGEDVVLPEQVNEPEVLA
jgi:DNA excision repair protein ERCC-4